MITETFPSDAERDAMKRVDRIGVLILALREARTRAIEAQTPMTLRKIRSALKSAEGALRHAEGLQASARRVTDHREMLLATVQRDHFVRGYVACALWASHDDQHENFDAFSPSDIETETLEKMIADCRSFMEKAGEHGDASPIRANDGDDAGSMGHDFFLTRNHHGAGFWDGDWPEPAATVLDGLAQSFGPFDLYVGDNGRISG